MKIIILMYYHAMESGSQNIRQELEQVERQFAFISDLALYEYEAAQLRGRWMAIRDDPRQNPAKVAAYEQEYVMAEYLVRRARDWDDEFYAEIDSFSV